MLTADDLAAYRADAALGNPFGQGEWSFDEESALDRCPRHVLALLAEVERVRARGWITVADRRPDLGVRVLISGTRGAFPMVEFARIVERSGGPAVRRGRLRSAVGLCAPDQSP